MEKYLIRPCKINDAHGITSLFRCVFKKDFTVEQWIWKYHIHMNEKIYSVVAETPSNEIIAHAGAIPLRGVYKNREIRFFQIADVMVHQDFRGYLGSKNVFNTMMKTLFERIADDFEIVFCYGFAGFRPFLLGKKIKVYDEIGYALESYKKLDRFFFCLFICKKIDWTERKLDTLWAHLSKDLLLSLIRDKNYLKYRYASNPFFNYELLGIFFFGELKGWVVIKDAGDDVYIIDLLIDKKNCKNALRSVENYIYLKKGKRIIRLWLPQVFRDINSYKESKTEIVVINMVWKMPLETSFARENLFYTMGDVDIF